ncbi:MarR family winged helix-turn-helix transcriptional regulator [Pseudonocardia acaciae]|uniref:MarR family winged helix-turn-helix transcriptional regulator n=1 Tax=Pseudonocardia acaciae TaxID=551276 RepID=UPI00048E28BE|nr:MarR family transcriptional regulator [Pseudonocardia acaciae]
MKQPPVTHGESSIAEQIARAARREGPGFDPTVLGITLSLLRASAELERAHVAELSPYRLTTSQFNVLTVLDRADEPLTMGRLGQAISVLPANLTSVVDALARREYVERLANERDRRSSLVRITESGRAFLRDFLPGHWAHLQRLMSDLRPEERTQLHSLLERFVESLRLSRSG